MYPSDTLLLAQGLTREEYYSRFLPAIWKVDGVDDKLLIRAIREARSARFEFGETPDIFLNIIKTNQHIESAQKGILFEYEIGCPFCCT